MIRHCANPAFLVFTFFFFSAGIISGPPASVAEIRFCFD
jgi:hypothetical protein